MDLEHHQQQQQQQQQQQNHHPHPQWNNAGYMNGGTNISNMSLEEKERLRRLKEIKQSEVERENEQAMRRKVKRN